MVPPSWTIIRHRVLRSRHHEWVTSARKLGACQDRLLAEVFSCTRARRKRTISHTLSPTTSLRVNSSDGEIVRAAGQAMMNFPRKELFTPYGGKPYIE